MKNISLLLVLSFILFSCEKEEPEAKCFESDPFEVEWLQEAKDGMANDSNFSNQTIIMYKYNGAYVFSVNACPQCPDSGVSIVDCNQKTVCSFGGITGENTCPDFYDTYTDLEVIYSE